MNKKGFTWWEVLVVIAIIGLLSTMSVVALGSAREKSRDSKRLSDIKQVQTALELYYTDQGSYPTTGVTLGDAEAATCLGATGFGTSCGDDAYMGLVPADPQADQSYVYTPSDATGSSYTITATLEGEVNGLTGSITANPSGITNVAAAS